MPQPRPHTEERVLTFRLTLRAEFPDDYDGDDDGYEWARDVPALQKALLQAIAETAARDKRWALRFENRGRPTEEELSLVLERKF